MRKENQVLKKYLTQKSLRASSRREIILTAFLKEEGHVTAEELHRKIVGNNPSIGIATVYRSLKLFHEAGLARKSEFGKGKTRYEHNYQHNHHDHLVCVRCGKIIEFESPEIEKNQENIARKNRFKIISHRLELFGECYKCSKE